MGAGRGRDPYSDKFTQQKQEPSRGQFPEKRGWANTVLENYHIFLQSQIFWGVILYRELLRQNSVEVVKSTGSGAVLPELEYQHHHYLGNLRSILCVCLLFSRVMIVTVFTT